MNSSLDDPSADTPLSLLEGLREENDAAWARLVDLWVPLLHGACRARGFKDSDADDITQGVIVRVYKGLSTFERDGIENRFRFWIMQIFRNEVADFVSKNANRPQAAGGTDQQILLQNAASNQSESDSDWFHPAKIMARLLELVKADFNEKNWQAFELITFENWSVDQVAEKLGMTANAVRQATYRIRRRVEEEGRGMFG